jgi:hypothetical protein
MESSPLPVIVRPAQEYFTYMENDLTDWLFIVFRPAQEFLDCYHATHAVFPDSSEGPPHSVAYYDTVG